MNTFHRMRLRADRHQTTASIVSVITLGALLAVAVTPSAMADRGAIPIPKNPSTSLVQALRDQAIAGSYRSAYQLGMLYELGRGVTKDNETAASWIRFAAAHGVVDAENEMADLYYHGEGVQQSYRKAFQWSLKAALTGNSAAETKTCYAYQAGQGVPQDFGKALNWCILAASQGNVIAENNLAAEYANDEDGYTNYRKAYFWADIAAASSVSSKLQKMSAQLRDEAAKHLTPDELKIMQRKAEVYFDERQEGGSDLLDHGHKIPSEDRNHVGESRPSQKTPAFEAPPSADQVPPSGRARGVCHSPMAPAGEKPAGCHHSHEVENGQAASG